MADWTPWQIVAQVAVLAAFAHSSPEQRRMLVAALGGLLASAAAGRPSAQG